MILATATLHVAQDPSGWIIVLAIVGGVGVAWCVIDGILSHYHDFRDRLDARYLLDGEPEDFTLPPLLYDVEADRTLIGVTEDVPETGYR